MPDTSYQEMINIKKAIFQNGWNTMLSHSTIFCEMRNNTRASI